MSDKMSDMKTVTVREAQRSFSRLIDDVLHGEEVVVTHRGRPVARLVAATAAPESVEWPDFEARLEHLFPDGPPAGKPASELIAEMREERS
jgi:prevent-host-death family protein